ncbi:MAG: hypothetical protein ACR2FO_06165 [Actinomycetota bacterium]
MSKSVQIRDVPNDLHLKLKTRAAGEGKSLSDYLLGELAKMAARPSIKEVLDRASRRPGPKVGTASIVAAVRAGRNEN